jgi:hypothetical protein
MQASGTKLNFSHQLKNCRTTNPNMPEDALAVNDQWLLQAYEKLQLKPAPPFYGGWSGHTPYPKSPTINFQDIIVATKR